MVKLVRCQYVRCKNAATHGFPDDQEALMCEVHADKTEMVNLLGLDDDEDESSPTATPTRSPAPERATERAPEPVYRREAPPRYYEERDYYQPRSNNSYTTPQYGYSYGGQPQQQQQRGYADTSYGQSSRSGGGGMGIGGMVLGGVAAGAAFVGTGLLVNEMFGDRHDGGDVTNNYYDNSETNYQDNNQDYNGGGGDYGGDYGGDAGDAGDAGGNGDY